MHSTEFDDVQKRLLESVEISRWFSLPFTVVGVVSMIARNIVMLITGSNWTLRWIYKKQLCFCAPLKVNKLFYIIFIGECQKLKTFTFGNLCIAKYVGGDLCIFPFEASSLYVRHSYYVVSEIIAFAWNVLQSKKKILKSFKLLSFHLIRAFQVFNSR